MASRSDAAANTAADAAGHLLDGGFLRLYGGRTLLAELRFHVPAFRIAKGGTAEMAPIVTYSATATGIASRFEAVAFDGTLVFSGDVGTDLRLDNAYIEAGSRVTIDTLTYTERR